MAIVLSFGLNDNDFDKLKRFCGLQNIICKAVEPVDYLKKLGSLAQQAAASAVIPEGSAHPSNVPLESLLLFCDCADSQVDGLLSSIKSNDISVDYKAVLTKTNSNWNYITLLAALREEKSKY